MKRWDVCYWCVESMTRGLWGLQWMEWDGMEWEFGGRGEKLGTRRRGRVRTVCEDVGEGVDAVCHDETCTQH